MESTTRETIERTTNSPTPAIFRVPVELWEMIIEHLNQRSHSSLRLANELISRKCSGRPFERVIGHRRVQLNTRSVASFKDRLKVERLRPWVKKVTFTFTTCPMICRQHSRLSEDAEALSKTLKDCFSSLREFQSLQLRGEGCGCDHDFEHEPYAAAQASIAYLVVIPVAIQKELTVPEVDLVDFPSALTPNTVLAPLRLPGVKEIAKSCRILSISMDVFEWISGRSDDDDGSLSLWDDVTLPDWVSYISDPVVSNAETAHRLRTLCSRIEELTLHLDGTIEVNQPRQALFHSIASYTHFPKLREFGVHADYIDSDTLVAFLGNHAGVDILTLGRLIYTKGEWAEVFLAIETMPALTKLILDNVYVKEENGDLSFMWPTGNGEGDRRTFGREAILNGSFRSSIE